MSTAGGRNYAPRYRADEALTAPCLRCGAGKNQPCLSPAGRPVAVHRERKLGVAKATTLRKREASYKPENEALLSVPCSACNAEVGKRCFSANGTYVRAHWVRVEAFAKTKAGS